MYSSENFFSYFFKDIGIILFEYLMQTVGKDIEAPE